MQKRKTGLAYGRRLGVGMKVPRRWRWVGGVGKVTTCKSKEKKGTEKGKQEKKQNKEIEAKEDKHDELQTICSVCGGVNAA